MCRWVGYFGSPVAPDELLYKPARSLIDQSRIHDPHVGSANGDGFGMGWYSGAESPSLYRSATPAWGDTNLRELAASLKSPLFVAHVRAATGTPVQQTNCHPFRFGRWLFVHNGFIDGFETVRRDLLLAVRPDLFGHIEGSTDSELMFYLALTFGLETDPIGGLERMAGFVEATGRAVGIEEPLQMTVGLTDGERLYAVRYASGPVANTLFVSGDVDALRRLYPDDERFDHFSEEARAVVSEPLADLPGFWHEVPPGSALVVQSGPDERCDFQPVRPS